MATTTTNDSSSSKENPLTFNPIGDLIFSEFIGTDSVGKCSLTLSRSSTCDEKSTVIYRIQTTNPSLYRVRPSIGILDPKTPSVEVDITMASYPTKKDKFQVRSLVVTEELPLASSEDNGDIVLKAFTDAQGKGATVSDHKMLVIAPPKPEEPVVEEKENSVPDVQSAQTAEAATSTTATEQQVPAEAGKKIKQEDGDAIAKPASEKTPIKDEASEMATLRAELQEAKAKIQILVAKNQELTASLSTAQQQIRSRAAATVAQANDEGVSESERLQHPATELPAGLTQAELEEMIRNQAGFPPMLVLLIALFAFLVGLLF